jgi:hypothetical protein
MTGTLPEDDSAIERRRLVSAWETYSVDTTAETDRRRLAASWNTPAWRKFQMAADMSQVARDLTVAGLRKRHPSADEQEIRFRLAMLLFDPETARHLCESECKDNENLDGD